MINNISKEYIQFYNELINYSYSFNVDKYIFEYISEIIDIDIEYILDINNVDLIKYYNNNNVLELDYFDNYTFKKVHNCNININDLIFNKTLSIEKVFLFNEIVKLGVPIYNNKDQTEHVVVDIHNAYMSLLVDFINYFDKHKHNIRNLIQNFL